jgi:sirohydrochlorin ferrochelatase
MYNKCHSHSTMSTTQSEAATHAVVLLAHGSRCDEAGGELERVVASLRARLAGPPVCLAYGELRQPSLAAVVAGLVASGIGRIVVLPYFLTLGRHVLRDVPDQVGCLAARHPGLELRLADHLGWDGRLVDILLDRLAAAVVTGQGGAP